MLRFFKTGFFAALVLSTGVSLAARPQPERVVWKMAELPALLGDGLETTGAPETVETKLGPAVWFDGTDDAFVSEVNPLVGFSEFTLEAVFKPEPDGYPSPRFMHFGGKTKRIMLEVRLTPRGEWYFDAHTNSGELGSRTLKDSTLLHPCGEWYTVTVVYGKGTVTSYVNGVKELSGELGYAPFTDGRASFGSNQNRSSHFKGTIYGIRVTPKMLNPKEFWGLHKRLNRK